MTFHLSALTCSVCHTAHKPFVTFYLPLIQKQSAHIPGLYPHLLSHTHTYTHTLKHVVAPSCRHSTSFTRKHMFLTLFLTDTCIIVFLLFVSLETLSRTHVLNGFSLWDVDKLYTKKVLRDEIPKWMPKYLRLWEQTTVSLPQFNSSL